MTTTERNVYPYLVFGGNAKEAMDFYLTIFPDTKIISTTYISKDDIGEEGKVLNGVFSLAGQQFMVMDMNPDHCPKLSWAFSLYFECTDETEFDSIFAKLSKNGSVIMGPEPIKIGQVNIRKGTWVTDRFGVTWQLVWN